jgi:hypothetical protein
MKLKEMEALRNLDQNTNMCTSSISEEAEYAATRNPESM